MAIQEQDLIHKLIFHLFSREIIKKRHRKKERIFERYIKAINIIKSEKRLPFAGKYLLQGNLSILNKYRGVADALDIKDLDQDAIVWMIMEIHSLMLRT